MKKRLLLGMLLFAGLTASAQQGGLADGSIAPDFTVTDINNNTHHLYEYLNQGKTVVIYISASWCGPCWQFHNTHYLSDIYNSYGTGSGGDGDVVILYIEGDAGTSVQSLYGTNTPQDVRLTQGDWVTDTPYPIIDAASIANDYQINSYPTIFRICPENKTTTQIQRGTPAQLLSSIQNGCQTVEGVQSIAKIDATDMRLCNSESTENIQATLRNYGTNALTVAQVVLKQDGTTIATQNYTGNLNQFSNSTITFSGIDLNAASDYNVELVTVNTTPATGAFKTKSIDVVAAGVGGNNIEARIYTDNYPGEISWNIKNSSGSIVASGGPYQPGPSSNGGAGGPDANTTKTAYFQIPEGEEGCLTVEFKDSYGDGWSAGSTKHGMELFSGGQSIYKEDAVGSFGQSKIVKNAYKTNGVLSTKAIENSDVFAVYPNPTTGALHFATQESVDVTVLDLTGKVILTKKGINNGESVNLSNLQKGMYIAKIKGATVEKTEKIILN